MNPRQSASRAPVIPISPTHVVELETDPDTNCTYYVCSCGRRRGWFPPAIARILGDLHLRVGHGQRVAA